MKKTIKMIAVFMAVVMMIVALDVTSFAATTSLTTPVVSISQYTSSTALKVSWKKVAGADKYYIYRRDTATGSLSLLAKTDKLYYKDSKITTDKTYYYKVKAVTLKNGKVTASSKTSSTVSRAYVSLTKPTIKATAKSASEVTLSWDKVSGATRYYMYYSTSKSGTYKLITYTTKNTYNIKNLNSSTTYYFKVASAKTIDKKVYKSSYSAVVSAKTQAKDGQVMVSFDAISNKDAGLPTGSAIVCLTMLLNHYGVDCTAKEVLKYFDCSTKFYTENGEKYGPYTAFNFVGDPASDKAYGYGTELTMISIAMDDLLEKKGITNIDSNSNVFKSYTSISKYLDAGNIILVRIRTEKKMNFLEWWTKYKGGDTLVGVNLNEKYVIICGYTKIGYICYDPASNKYEEYASNPVGYDLIMALMPLTKK